MTTYARRSGSPGMLLCLALASSCAAKQGAPVSGGAAERSQEQTAAANNARSSAVAGTVMTSAGTAASAAVSGNGIAPTGAAAASGSGAAPRTDAATAGAPAASSGVAGSAAAGGSDRSAESNAGNPAGSAGATGSTPGEEPAGDGCPLELEGFATQSEDGQSRTSGGSPGETVTVSDQADLTNYAEADAPYVIRVEGALKLTPKGTEVHIASNKTIIGVGAQSQIVEGGFFLADGVHNVIIRNLTISGTFVEGDWEGKTQDFDGVQMDNAHHVWIDHCHFHHIGDGIIDSRKDTTFLTVSWNILSDHNKAFGIGWTDNVTAQITIHHNWLRDTNQRNPSTDNVLRAHLYNNWLQRISSYGNYARGGTNMVLENSVFESVKDPHFYDSGSLVASGNLYVDSTGKRDATGSTYDFFDPHDFYTYTLTPAADVTRLLQACAGPRATLGR